jgi:predicted RNase H-like nuclease (RuvC/YqgF family)
MHRKGSILLPVLIALFIISLFAAAGVFYLYQKEFAQNIKLQAQVVELENRQRQTADQLEESKKVATELTLKLQEARSKMDSMSNELSQEKAAHLETSNKLEQLKDDLSNQKSLRQDLENKLAQLQEDSKQIKEQIRIMQEQKASLEQKIKNLEEGSSNVELGKVVVNNEEVAPVNTNAAAAIPARNVVLPSSNGLEGKVMIVNKEFNFVVINLGSKDKVKVGDEFLVYRSGRTVGEIKVEKVHEFMSAAGFPVDLKDAIRENDTVKQKAK